VRFRVALLRATALPCTVAATAIGAAIRAVPPVAAVSLFAAGLLWMTLFPRHEPAFSRIERRADARSIAPMPSALLLDRRPMGTRN
jgi:hypothetical protein